jgi:hypothetical protein
MALTQRQQQIKHEFIAVRGTWSTAWQQILELDGEFLRAYLDWSGVPLRKCQLEPKVREFVFVAADAAATHLYEPGIRQHVRAASTWRIGRRGDGGARADGHTRCPRPATSASRC